MAVRLSSITKGKDKVVSLDDITRVNIRDIVENTVDRVMNKYAEDVLKYEKEMGRFFLRVKGGDGSRDFRMCVEGVREVETGKWEVTLREVQMWSAMTAPKCVEYSFGTVKKIGCAVKMWEMLEEIKRECGGSVRNVKLVQQEDTGESSFNRGVKMNIRDWWDNLDKERAEEIRGCLKTLGEKLECGEETKYKVREHKAVIRVMLPFGESGSDSGYGYGDNREAGVEKLRKAVELLGKFKGMPGEKVLKLTCLPGVWECGFSVGGSAQVKEKIDAGETGGEKLEILTEAMGMIRETGMKFSEVDMRQLHYVIPCQKPCNVCNDSSRKAEAEAWMKVRDKFNEIADKSGAMLHWDMAVVDAWAEMNERVVPENLQDFICAVRLGSGKMIEDGAAGRLREVVYLSKDDSYHIACNLQTAHMLSSDETIPCFRVEDFIDAAAEADVRGDRCIVINRKDIRDLNSL